MPSTGLGTEDIMIKKKKKYIGSKPHRTFNVVGKTNGETNIYNNDPVPSRQFVTFLKSISLQYLLSES